MAGSTGPVGRHLGDESLAPLQVALGRLILGTATILLIVAVRRESVPGGGEVWFHLAVAALLFNALPFSLFAFGEKHTTSILAGIQQHLTQEGHGEEAKEDIAGAADHVGEKQRCGAAVGAEDPTEEKRTNQGAESDGEQKGGNPAAGRLYRRSARATKSDEAPPIASDAGNCTMNMREMKRSDRAYLIPATMDLRYDEGACAVPEADEAGKEIRQIMAAENRKLIALKPKTMRTPAGAMRPPATTEPTICTTWAVDQVTALAARRSSPSMR